MAQTISWAALERKMASDFAALFPTGWRVRSTRQTEPGFDELVSVRAPDGVEARFAVEVKRTVAPRDVPLVVRQMREAVARYRSPVALVVAAQYLSELSREAFEHEGVGYLDATGNVLVQCDRPALFIKSSGASRDPSPSDDKLRSLGGTGSAQAVRALLDFRPPYGIRELAERGGVALGTLSRTVELLDRDGLVERVTRGPIERVDVAGVVKRWAKDYSVTGSNRVTSVLSPRGIPWLKQRLVSSLADYAATGALAASEFTPVAPTRLAPLYVRDAVEFAERFGLRSVDAGANVWLIEPANDVVFERTRLRRDLVCVSPSQLAVDLLTGPGRDPAEGEELLAWMERNPDEWRA